MIRFLLTVFALFALYLAIEDYIFWRQK